MKNKTHVIFLLPFITFCCTKEEYDVDKNSIIVNDTASFITSVNYISHTTTMLEIEVDVVTYIGEQCAVNYSSYYFVDTSLHDADLSFTQTSSDIQTSVSQNYSSILLIDRATLGWHRINFTGQYMQRFFENKDASDQLALAFFDANDYDAPHFVSENPDNFYDNTASFNVQQFYNITQINPSLPENNEHATLFVLGVLDRTLDSMIASSYSGGVRSITLVSASSIQDPMSEPDFSNFLAKAQSANVKINIICDDGSGMRPMNAAAHYTGGCIYDRSVNVENSENTDYNLAVYRYGVFLQNIDRTLHQDYTFNRCRLLISSVSGTFVSGSEHSLTLAYGGTVFRNVFVRIP